MTVATEFAHDGRQNRFGHHLADVPERVGENRLLEVNLSVRLEVLHHAAAAGARSDAEMGARGRDALLAGLEDVLDDAHFVRGLVADLLVGDRLAGQRAFDEDDLAVVAGHAASFGVEFVNLHFKDRADFFLTRTHGVPSRAGVSDK